MAYHFLHGDSPPPQRARPFTKCSVNYPNAFIKLNTGTLGSMRHGTIYGRLTSLVIGDAVTEVDITFSALSRDSLPEISVLAPEPTLHVGGSIFPAREIRTTDAPGREMRYTFAFGPINGIEGESVNVYLKEGSAQSITLANPTPEVTFSEETGTNVWGILIILSVVSVVACWLSMDDGPKELSDTLLGHWREMDSARQKAAKTFSAEDEPSVLAERHRAAQQSLSRAEQIIMDSYEDNLRSRVMAAWACCAILVACLVVVALFNLNPTGTMPGAFGHNLGGASPAGVHFSERLKLLDAGRSSKTGYLVLATSIGLAAMAANWFLSAWHTKAETRKLIRRRLGEFDILFQDQIIHKVDDAERALQQMKVRVSTLSEDLETVHSGMLAHRGLFEEAIP